MSPICGVSDGAATFTSALCPAITSPDGSASTVVIPAAASRVRSASSTFTASAARACGFMICSRFHRSSSAVVRTFCGSWGAG